MHSNDKVIVVMQGLQQARARRAWCLVKGARGSGKTHSVQDALHQLGWESVWKGPDELPEDVETLHLEPPEVLVLDGMVDEWAPQQPEESPVHGWSRYYQAVCVAMARARNGLLSVVCADCDEVGKPGEVDSLRDCIEVDIS